MSMHPGVKLRHLRLFLQIADSGSLTAAARSLGLSQPALSKSLAEMEALLGAVLFLRLGRRMILTAEGERLRRHARDALASLDAGALAVQGDAGRQRLSVGLLPTVSTRFFPAVVSRFLTECPGVTLSIETGAHPFLLRKLRERRIDLMIGRKPDVAEMPGLEFEYLYEEPVIAVLRAGHPAAGMPIRTILRDYPLILPTTESIIRRIVDDYLSALGLAALDPAVETSTLALGRGLVLATDAIWFISKGVVANEIDDGQLTVVPLGANYLSGIVGLFTLVGHARSLPLQHLVRLCLSRAAGGMD